MESPNTLTLNQCGASTPQEPHFFHLCNALCLQHDVEFSQSDISEYYNDVEIHSGLCNNHHV
jgi:hypothetical protein